MATYRVSEDLKSISVRSEEEKVEQFVETILTWISDYIEADRLAAVEAELKTAYWFVR